MQIRTEGNEGVELTILDIEYPPIFDKEAHQSIRDALASHPHNVKLEQKKIATQKNKEEKVIPVFHLTEDSVASPFTPITEGVVDGYLKQVRQACEENDDKQLKIIFAKAKIEFGKTLGSAYQGLESKSLIDSVGKIINEVCDKNQLDLLFLFAENEFDFNRWNERSNYPLGIAADKNYYDLMGLLVELGADISFHLALSTKDTARILIRCRRDDLKTYCYCVSLGARDKWEFTPKEKLFVQENGIKYVNDYQDEIYFQLSFFFPFILKEHIIDYIGKKTYSIPPIEDPLHYIPRLYTNNIIENYFRAPQTNPFLDTPRISHFYGATFSSLHSSSVGSTLTSVTSCQSKLKSR